MSRRRRERRPNHEEYHLSLSRPRVNIVRSNRLDFYTSILLFTLRYDFIPFVIPSLMFIFLLDIENIPK